MDNSLLLNVNTRFRTSAGGVIIKGFLKKSLKHNILAFKDSLLVVTNSLLGDNALQ